jgi:hypothetical protein
MPGWKENLGVLGVPVPWREPAEEADECAPPARFGARLVRVGCGTLLVEAPLITFRPTIQPRVSSHDWMFPAGHGTMRGREVASRSCGPACSLSRSSVTG